MTSGAAIPPVMPGRASAPRRRCVRHDEREAVGRCTACGGAFCRECVTEHEDRLYCGPCFAQCVGGDRTTRPKRRINWGRWKALVLTAGSVVCAVLCFYWLGRVLAAVPADLHDGTIWKELSGQ